VPDYLLDTNIPRYWYDTGCPQHTAVFAHVKAIRQPDSLTGYTPKMFVSVVTIGEIAYGHRVAGTPDAAKQAEYEKFVREQCPEPLEITRHVGEAYGEMRAWLFNKFVDKTKRSHARRAEEMVDPTTGRELGVQENDLWIAAQAMTYKFVLVTHDSKRHFGDLLRQFCATLQVEDWAV
jgi:tRNA(fMet)-specific endonuclease VapC